MVKRRLLLFAHLCSDIYSPKELIFTARHKAKLIRETKFTGVRFALVENYDESIIVIRGSKGLKNYMTDSFFFPKFSIRLGFFLSHKGFYFAAKEVFESIKDDLNPKKPITVTGHSLGGAVGFILALMLKNMAKLKVNGVVTFGQPKFASSTARFSYSGLKSLRVVDYDDSVIYLPPSVLFMSPYSHFGPELFFGNDVMKPELIDSGIFKWNLRNLITRFFGGKVEHDMPHYIRIIKESPKLPEGLSDEI